MKVVFLMRPNHPASLHRVIQYLPYLKGQGIETRTEFFPHGVFAWLKLLKRIKGAEIVFIQKKKVQGFWLSRMKRRGAKIIFDVDDAIMFNSPRHKSPDSPLRLRRYIKMVRNCDGIICGNSYLVSLTSPYHSRIWILPRAVDLSQYSVKSYEESLPPNHQFVLGWLGGAKSLFFLKQLLPVIEGLSRKYNIALKVVCSEFFDHPQIKIIKKLWWEEDEVADMLGFDIGLSYLSDDPWSRGKCASKLLQYMGAGIPSVASPVGVHTEIIQDGVNGYLAVTPQDWTDKLSALIEKHDLRKRLGLAGRKTVEERYSLKVNAPKMLAIFQEILRTS